MPAPTVPAHLMDAYMRLRRFFTVEQATALACAGFDVLGFVVLP